MSQTLTIPIVYEDSNVLVVNKPAGLVVHSDGKTKEPALTDWILKQYPNIKGVGEPGKLSDGTLVDRPGIVHRLDRDTSGVLIIAKNQEAFLFLKAQFQDREMEKVYCAFVYGEVKNDTGVIDRPIARSRNDFRLWSAQRGTRGQARDAITEYVVRGRHEGYSCLDLFPKTGRTHQLRVHLKAINYPIVCDPLYAPGREAALGFERLALHAVSLRCTLPGGDSKDFVAPFPKDFLHALKIFGISKVK